MLPNWLEMGLSGPQNFAKSPPIIWLAVHRTNICGDFAKFCGLLRIHELNLNTICFRASKKYAAGPDLQIYDKFWNAHVAMVLLARFWPRAHSRGPICLLNFVRFCSALSQFTCSDRKYFPFSNWNIFLSLVGIFSFFSLEYFPFSD